MHVPSRNVERTLNITHINRGPNDLRRMDIITSGLSGVFGGKPLFIDATLVSPIKGNGEPISRASDSDGIALSNADKKNRTID